MGAHAAMRIALALLPLAAATAAAAASQGVSCTGVDRDVEVSVTLAAGLARTPLAASLRDGANEARSWGLGKGGTGDPAGTGLVIGQSWLDRGRLWLDLLDVEGRARVARLRVVLADPGDGSDLLGTGTLVLGAARVVEVECRPN